MANPADDDRSPSTTVTELPETQDHGSCVLTLDEDAAATQLRDALGEWLG